VFVAELAVFAKLHSVGVVLFVLFCVIISLLTFRASQCNFCSHFGHLVKILRKQKTGLLAH